MSNVNEAMLVGVIALLVEDSSKLSVTCIDGNKVYEIRSNYCPFHFKVCVQPNGKYFGYIAEEKVHDDLQTEDAHILRLVVDIFESELRARSDRHSNGSGTVVPIK